MFKKLETGRNHLNSLALGALFSESRFFRCYFHVCFFLRGRVAATLHLIGRVRVKGALLVALGTRVPPFY